MSLIATIAIVYLLIGGFVAKYQTEDDTDSSYFAIQFILWTLFWLPYFIIYVIFNFFGAIIEALFDGW